MYICCLMSAVVVVLSRYGERCYCRCGCYFCTGAARGVAGAYSCCLMSAVVVIFIQQWREVLTVIAGVVIFLYR